jgi:hypothetical protein
MKSEKTNASEGGMTPEDTASRWYVERYFERCGIDPTRCETSSPVRTTRFGQSEPVGKGFVGEAVTTDLSDYGVSADQWLDLSWVARRDACEWLEHYHEVRVEAFLLTPDHRREFEAHIAEMDRPKPEDFPWFLLEMMYQTAKPGWAPQFAALGRRF